MWKKKTFPVIPTITSIFVPYLFTSSTNTTTLLLFFNFKLKNSSAFTSTTSQATTMSPGKLGFYVKTFIYNLLDYPRNSKQQKKKKTQK